MKKLPLFLVLVLLLQSSILLFAQGPKMDRSERSDSTVHPSIPAENNLSPTLALSNLSIADYCNCKLKVQLFQQKYWLAEQHSLQDLLWVLQAGGSILRTKHLSKHPGHLQGAWAESDLPDSIKALLSEQDQRDCAEWKCRLRKLGSKVLMWILEVYLQEGRVF